MNDKSPPQQRTPPPFAALLPVGSSEGVDDWPSVIESYARVRAQALADFAGVDKVIALLEAKRRFLDGRGAVLISTDVNDLECLQVIADAITRLIDGTLCHLELIGGGGLTALLKQHGTAVEQRALAQRCAEGSLFITPKVDLAGFLARACSSVDDRLDLPRRT